MISLAITRRRRRSVPYSMKIRMGEEERGSEGKGESDKGGKNRRIHDKRPCVEFGRGRGKEKRCTEIRRSTPEASRDKYALHLGRSESARHEERWGVMMMRITYCERQKTVTNHHRDCDIYVYLHMQHLKALVDLVKGAAGAVMLRDLRMMVPNDDQMVKVEDEHDHYPVECLLEVHDLRTKPEAVKSVCAPLAKIDH
jgi:hypothetical protein